MWILFIQKTKQDIYDTDLEALKPLGGIAHATCYRLGDVNISLWTSRIVH